MGFMGFGMQKWIYTMRPRKPFSMQRKSSFTTVPTYKRNFKLQSSSNKGIYNLGILIIIILTVVVISTIPKWISYARENYKAEIELDIKNDNKAFEFLMTSGKRRLETQNYEGAFSEFKLANAIQPNNSEVNQLLLETLSILCFNEGKYCNDLDDLAL